MIAFTQHESPRNTRRADVAAAAGVSATAVTHALNNTVGARLAQATRQRIIEAAARLGYRAHSAARALRTGRTQTVGLLLPGIEAIEYDLYHRILRGLAVQMEADDYHFLMLFCRADGSHLRAVDEQRLDGIFVLQSERGTWCIDQVLALHVPTVILNKTHPVGAFGHAVCIHADHARAMHAAVAELVNCGCRELLALYDHQTWDANAQLYRAFGLALRRLAPQGVKGSVLIPSYPDRRTHFPDVSGVRAQLGAMLRQGRKWDGIFVNGDTTAEALVGVGLEHGLRPGRDYELITAHWVPGTCTRARLERSAYTQQPELVGAPAWRMMKALINGQKVARRIVKIPYQRFGVRVADAHTPPQPASQGE